MKTRTKIVGATISAVFSLATVFSVTIAWFSTNAEVNASNMQIVVQSNGTCEIDDIKLIKFDYSTKTIGSLTYLEYLKPEEGTVNKYDYDYDNHSFGTYEAGAKYYQWNGSSWDISDDDPGSGANGTVSYPSELEELTPEVDDYYLVTNGDWNAVEAMNVYDPVDMIVRGTGLKDLNCNAIYEVSFTSPNDLTYALTLTSSLFTVADLGEDILLSDCVDIDIFFESDLLDSNPLFFQEDNGETLTANEYNDRLYYPSYKLTNNNKYYQWDGSDWQESVSEPLTGSDKGTILFEDLLPISDAVEDAPTTGDYYRVLKTSAVLSENEEVYHKISYLSSLLTDQQHKHFYGSPKQSEITIVSEREVAFTAGIPIKFYINVNYAPAKADRYFNRVSLSNVRAQYDYYFNFSFRKVNS